MRSLQDEIRQAQRDLSCPICGRTFNLRDIHVRSFATGGSVDLSIVCSRGHFPVILLVPVSLKEINKAGPISNGEMKKIKKRIESLDQDVQALIGNSKK